MTPKCPKCGHTPRVVSFVITSDACQKCGYLPLQARITRLILQVVALFLLLCGMALLWRSVKLMNQEYFHFFHPSTTYLFENRAELLTSMILSALMGIIICAVSLFLFDLTIQNLHTKAKKVFEFLRRVSAKASPFALIFLCMVLFVMPAWIFFDACFQPALTWARVDLGIPDEMGLGYLKLNSISELSIAYGKSTFFERAHAISALGPRIGVMVFLLCGIPLAFLLSLMHIVLNGASKKYILVLTLVMCGITALYYQQENLMWFSVQRRLATNLVPFQMVQKSLSESWPTTSGMLPEVGKYFAHEQRPGEIYLRDSVSYGIAESMGSNVRKLPDGGIAFSMGPHYLFLLEYHPPDCIPLNKLQSKDFSEFLVRSAEVDEGWYLTQYESVRK